MTLLTGEFTSSVVGEDDRVESCEELSHSLLHEIAGRVDFNASVESKTSLDLLVDEPIGPPPAERTRLPLRIQRTTPYRVTDRQTFEQMD